MGKRKLAELAAALERGELDDAEYDRRVDEILGTALPERDPEREKAWQEAQQDPDRACLRQNRARRPRR